MSTQLATIPEAILGAHADGIELLVSDRATQKDLLDIGSGGGGSITAADITDASADGRALLTAADKAAQRASLGLGSAAVQSSSAFDAAGMANAAYATAAADLSAHVVASDPHGDRGYAASQASAAAAFAVQRGNHSGTQALSTITGVGNSASRNVGAAAGTVCAGDDARLSDARTPTAHTHTASQISDATTPGRTLLTAADQAAQRTALALVPGTDVQAFDAQLASVAALAYAGNGLKAIRVNAGESGFELATVGGGGSVLLAACGLRLTTENGVAVSTADRTAQGTLHGAPADDASDEIVLHDGSSWVLFSGVSPSLALSGLIGSGEVRDIWGIVSGGAPAFELSAAWTNDTTRSQAIARSNGVWCKSGDPTRRLLGTVVGTGSGQVEDSGAKRFVANLQNRVLRPLVRLETNGTWAYTVDTWRQANGSTSNQVEWVCPLPTFAEASAHSRASNNGSSTTSMVAIGYDSASAPAGLVDRAFGSGSNVIATMHTQHAVLAAAGRHRFTWLERSPATGVTTWYGVSSDIIQCGLFGKVFS